MFFILLQRAEYLSATGYFGEDLGSGGLLGGGGLEGGFAAVGLVERGFYSGDYFFNILYELLFENGPFA